MTYLKSIFSGLVILVLLLSGQTGEAAKNTPIPAQLPVKNMVTMIDLGADKCIPCKMMAPILKEVREDYRGRAAIVFIDVWKNKGMDKKFGIRTIPTQIFYDKTGKEMFRHEGFLDKKNIAIALAKLGVAPSGAAQSGSAVVTPRPQTSQRTPVQSRPQQVVAPPRVYPPQPGVPRTGAAPMVAMRPGDNYQPGRPQTGVRPGGRLPVGAGGAAAGLLTPGVVNLLFLDANVSQPKENVLKEFSEIESQYPGRISILIVDANTNRELLGSMGVRSAPMSIVYDLEGREALRYAGAPNLEALRGVLDKLTK